MWFCGTARWLSAVTGIKSSSVFQWNVFKLEGVLRKLIFQHTNYLSSFLRQHIYSDDHSNSFIKKSKKKLSFVVHFNIEAPFVGSLHSELQFDERYKQLLDSVALFLTVKVQFALKTRPKTLQMCMCSKCNIYRGNFNRAFLPL